MKHGSLFSGIGGFDLGFERAGIETAWQVEINDYCRRVLARHFPGAQRHTDIRECGAHNLTAVDVVSGGFPCQDISNAGKRAGIDAERSGLWREYYRIICELRPRYVVVENVSALLHRGIERVLGDLAACGYDAEWDCIPASAVGAPHRRDRVWIVAYPACKRQHRVSRELQIAGAASIEKRNQLRGSGEDVAYPNAERCGRRQNDEGQAPTERRRLEDGGETLAYADSGRRERRDAAEREISKPDQGSPRNLSHPEHSRRQGWDSQRVWTEAVVPCDWWLVEPDVGRVAHGIPARVDRLRGLGNAIIPQIAEWIGRRIIANEPRA